jgi:hypothetical protein
VLNLESFPECSFLLYSLFNDVVSVQIPAGVRALTFIRVETASHPLATVKYFLGNKLEGEYSTSFMVI